MSRIKHDVRVRMFLSGQWEDVTDYVMQRSTITITRGAKDERTQVPPSTARLEFLNNDGRFSIGNPLGPWYDTLGQNNPIVISKRLISWTPSAPLTNSWGRTDEGPGWTSYPWAPLDNPNDFDVALTGATVLLSTAGNIRRATLTGYSPKDARAELEYSIPVGDVTGSYIVAPGPALRDEYYARVEISAAEVISLGIRKMDGTVLAGQTNTGLTHVSGERYRVCLIADGQTLAAKVWRTSDGEPRDWAVTTTTAVPKVAGAVGMRTAVSTTNTNVPFSVSVHQFMVESVRITNEVSGYPVTSKANGRDQSATVESAGILRRLGQGKSATESTLRRGVMTTEPVAYWPCEEGPDATTLSSAIEGVAPMSIIEHGSGPPDFAAFDGFACSQPIPVMNDTAWVGVLPNYDASAGTLQARMLVSVPDAGSSVDVSLLRLDMLSGTAPTWIVFLEPDGQLNVRAYAPDGTEVLNSGSIGFDMNGRGLRFSFELEQQGADVHWSLSTLDPFGSAGGFGADLAGRTIGQVLRLTVGATANLAVGHVTFESEIADIFEILPQLQAYAGERAGTRMLRLAGENNVPFSYYGTPGTSIPVGPQRVDTFLNLIRSSVNAAADADLGTLYESRGINALVYRDRTSLYAQPSALTLPLSRVREPFQPVVDDQTTRNDITLKRTLGGEFRVTKETGRKSVQPPPDGVGVYDDAPELNYSSDTQLPDAAGFMLALGTVDAPRYPAMRVDTSTLDAADIQQVLDLDVNDRITVDEASGVFVFDDINQIARGYTEVLGNHVHTFNFTLSPSEPYDIGTIDDGVYRLGTDTSTLTDQLSETALSFSVTETEPDNLWPTSGIFPMDVMVGGERVTISGITGTSSPQTFAVSARSVNGVRKSHAAGTGVDVVNRWRLGL